MQDSYSPLTYESEFLKGITIAVVFSESPNYEKFIPLFDEYGYGFMVPNENLIVIDGEYLLENQDPSILKFIEAHEIAHIILGHDGPRNRQDEMDADLGAYILLRSKGKDAAIKHLLDNFEGRHGEKFNMERLEKLKKHFSDHRHN